MSSSVKPAKIRKLDETVINRIAAGEVIQRPANALKELMENSLDAGATSIQITVKSGGLKLLQIQDDGTGINKEDLGIVCERFTTSKLEKFEDLEEIATYGFRGEALASISHVAHLTIITKTADSMCAYKAEYTDGKLKVLPGNAPNPKACAGNKGTIIIVEDLFYNMETRRRALKNPNEEHNRVVDQVGRYAIHNSNVGFSVKKQGDSGIDLRTPPNSTPVENIKLIYGPQIARELLEVKHEDEHFNMTGQISNVNYSTKKFTFLLFINHRSVDSSAIRKAVDSVYSSYLPKGSHPFLYLSFEINPRNVDVNVHPTKSEVRFLHEDIIITRIANVIEAQLLGSNQSRTYYVQTMLPGAAVSEISSSSTPSSSSQKPNTKESVAKIDRLVASSSSFTTQRDPRNLVRTDTRMQKLDKFFTSAPSSSQSKTNSEIVAGMQEANSGRPSWQPNSSNNDTNLGEKTAISRDPCANRREIRLKSVKTLMATVKSHCHKGLEELFRGFTFVGCVDRTRALVQHETKLYMVNTTRVSMELFYQRVLWDFGNFGRIRLTKPVSIAELANIGLEALQDSGALNMEEEERSRRAQEVQKLLISRSDMLDDYFSLKIDRDGQLRTLPLLLGNYFPNMDGLPSYVLNLAENVKWNGEQECFETFAHQTAVFYAIQPGGSLENDEIGLNGKSWKWTIEFVVYPEIKKSLLPPQAFTRDSTVVELANLPNLYKVFERC